MQKLPIGIQSFENLRDGGFLYVDKTKEMHRMATSGSVFFLSRPRRFGKSLLLSALEALFKGEKRLFEGLYIYDKWDWEEHFPVIRLDFGGRAYSSGEELNRSLTSFVELTAKSYQLSLEECTLPDKFRELLEKLHHATGRKAVVLVDEYDKPITDHLSSLEVAEANRKTLQAFYQVLKAADEHLRFIFLTGVSKFSKVSIFSGLNNLNDITMDDKYATICGYTQAELESCFDEHIREMAEHHKQTRDEIIAEIRHWYNGYSWDGATSVYNPFSTLLLFDKKMFVDYWFATGTPTFLVNLIKERNDAKALLEPVLMQSSGFDSFEYQTLDSKLLSFQTGYLTVKKREKSMFDNTLVYTLGFPNEEVRQALVAHLVGSYAACPASDAFSLRERMMRQLFEGSSSAFERSAQEMFARIPYQLHVPREAYYHSLLLLWLNLLGFKVEAEISTDKGRIDAVWTWGDRVVIAEVKYSIQKKAEPLVEKAFAQLLDRRYHERYAGEGKRILLLAVAFAGKEVACSMKELPDSAHSAANQPKKILPNNHPQKISPKTK
ncbi:MAG: ATP-binding protein [Prevotellaceae bacterium]|jgi:hypothetical protein|nr:ATP-binding protein [Prevotellaceae bacterium]